MILFAVSEQRLVKQACLSSIPCTKGKKTTPFFSNPCNDFEISCSTFEFLLALNESLKVYSTRKAVLFQELNVASHHAYVPYWELGSKILGGFIKPQNAFIYFFNVSCVEYLCSFFHVPLSCLCQFNNLLIHFDFYNSSLMYLNLAGARHFNFLVPVLWRP